MTAAATYIWCSKVFNLRSKTIWCTGPPFGHLALSLFAFWFRLAFPSVKHVCVITLCRITMNDSEWKLALAVPGSADCTRTGYMPSVCVCASMWSVWACGKTQWGHGHGCRVWLHVCCPSRASDTGSLSFVFLSDLHLLLFTHTLTHTDVRACARSKQTQPHMKLFHHVGPWYQARCCRLFRS